MNLCPICSCLMLGYCEETNQKMFLHFTTHLAHLELEETSLLFHLLCNFSPCDLRADHSVLFGVLTFLLLNLCTVTEERLITNCSHKVLIESILIRLRICFPFSCEKKTRKQMLLAVLKSPRSTQIRKTLGDWGLSCFLRELDCIFTELKTALKTFHSGHVFALLPKCLIKHHGASQLTTGR